MGSNASVALNDPDIVTEMVRNLLLGEFEKHLKINRLWYKCCKAELWKRYEKAEAAYKQAVDHYREAEEAFWQDCADGNKNHDKPTDVFAKAYREKSTSFEEIVAIFRAMLRCGFVTKESNKVEYLWIRLNTQMFKDGIIPGEFDEKVDQAIQIVRKRVYSDKF
jgi:tetratricopeptide (TPR) repeat protein